MINLPMDKLVELIEEVISTDGVFKLYPRGTSMLPLIVEGKDSVSLIKPSLLSKYDIVLYKRKSGQFVLHRIIDIKDENLILCGDNQDFLEYNIPKDWVIAKVQGIYKDEVYYDGVKANFKFYYARLWYKRVFKVQMKRVLKAIKHPSVIWRKLKGE